MIEHILFNKGVRPYLLSCDTDESGTYKKIDCTLYLLKIDKQVEDKSDLEIPLMIGGVEKEKIWEMEMEPSDKSAITTLSFKSAHSMHQRPPKYRWIHH